MSGHATHALKLDIEKHFDHIDHDVLLHQLQELVVDEGVNWLAGRFVRSEAPGCPSGRGLPIGNLTSQYFANLYLGPLDRLVEGLPGVTGFVRYMDDLVIFGDKPSLQEAWWRLSACAHEVLKLRLRSDVCQLEPVQSGVPFLGWRIWPRLLRLDKARIRRLRRGLRLAMKQEDVASMTSRVAWAEVGNTHEYRQSFLRRENASRHRLSGKGKVAPTG